MSDDLGLLTVKVQRILSGIPVTPTTPTRMGPKVGLVWEHTHIGNFPKQEWS